MLCTFKEYKNDVSFIILQMHRRNEIARVQKHILHVQSNWNFFEKNGKATNGLCFWLCSGHCRELSNNWLVNNGQKCLGCIFHTTKVGTTSGQNCLGASLYFHLNDMSITSCQQINYSFVLTNHFAFFYRTRFKSQIKYKFFILLWNIFLKFQ